MTDTQHNSPRLEGSIWFSSGSHSWGNPRRMALLAAIEAQGSITAAAKQVGLSYKGAWDAVDAMNNLAGEPLVQRSTGGQRGGGARLTDRARELLSLYQYLNQEHERFLAMLASVHHHDSRNLELIQHMMFQVSIRNRISCQVVAIDEGQVKSLVTLQTGHALRVQALITQASVRNLQLTPGRRVIALIKASSLSIDPVSPHDTDAAPGENQIIGRVTHLLKDDSDVEVQLALENGLTLTGTCSHSPVDGLGLKTGDLAVARFPAHQVMLGVLD